MVQLLMGAWRQIGLAVGVAGVFLGMYYYPERAPFLKFEATVTHGWMLTALAVWVGLTVALRKTLWRFFVQGLPGAAEKAQRWGLIAVLLVTAVYLLGHTEARYRMLSDEHNHLQVAMSMHYFQRAERCDEGNFFDTDLQCHKFVTDIRPKTFPMMTFLGYSLFGFRESVPFWMNFAIYFLTAILIFRLARELGLQYWGQLFAMLAWLYWPINLWWARSAGYELTYVFFVSLSCLGAWWLRHHSQPAQSEPVKKEKYFAALWLGVTTAFACQTRHEAYIMMPVILAPVMVYYLKNWIPAVLSLLSWAIAVVPGVVVRAAFKGDFLTDHNGAPAAGWSNIASNLPNNIEFLLNWTGQWPTHFWLTLLAIAGMAVLLGHAFKKTELRAPSVWLMLWFWGALISISYFYWGKFQLFAHMRYSVPVYVPLALLAGYAAGKWVEWKNAMAWIRYAFLIFFAAIAIKSASIVEGNRLLNAILLTNEDHYFSEVIERLPQHSVFIYTRPAAFLVRKRSAYSYYPLLTSAGNWLEWSRVRADGHVYYVRGLDCWRDKKVNFQEIDAWNQCDQVEAEFDLEPVMTFPVAGNYSLKVSRVLGPKAKKSP